MFEEDLIHVGFISRSHGYAGVFKVVFLPAFRLIKPLKGFIFLSINNKAVPFEIVDCSDEHESFALIKTREINSSDELLPFLGLKVLIKKSELARVIKEGLNEIRLTGFTVINQNHQILGKVAVVEKTPAHYLLELDNHTLIPLHNDFIISIKEEEGIIYMNLPEGIV